jgi:DNA-binding transcriptional regulator YiaG
MAEAARKIDGRRKQRAKLRLVKAGAKARKVPRIRQAEWRHHRMDLFEASTKYAAAAKAYRTALNVRLEDMGRFYGVTNQAASNWESGRYFGWTDEDLAHYTRAVDWLAGKGPRPE